MFRNFFECCFVIILQLCTNAVFGEITIKEVIDEYYPEYCHSLEAVYGKGMMSEGGNEAIDFMFKNLSICNKKALDIGSGLGGVAYYLAKKYDMEVTGIEINPWMIKEATQRAPAQIQNKLRFVLSTNNEYLPFGDNSFDIVYSKGVLCHIEKKQGILKECHRILKPNGVLIINDWLSPVKGKWGGYIQHLVELEGLSLHAETIDNYLQLLREANFKEIKTINLSEKYALYNEEIVKELKTPTKKELFIHSFNERLHKEAIDGYESIANAMRSGEGMVIQFTSHK